MTKKYIMFKSTLGVCFLVLLFAQIISNVQSSIDDDMITVVSTVDGYVHAIDSRMQKLWSTDTGGSTIKSQNSALNQEAVIPAVDGSLLVHSKEGMLKTSVTARMLTEHTPFISKDGILYHGRKSNRIVGLNAYDGNIIHDSNWESTNSIVRRVESKSPHRKLSPIWIGRMDYAVRATKADNGEEQFNFSYGEIKPLRGNSGVQHASLLEDSDGSIVSVEDFAGQSIISTPSGQVYFSDRAGTSFIDYPIELNSPVQSAFQVKFSNSQISRPNKSKYSIQNVEVYHKRDRHDPAYSDKKELALVPKEEVNLRSEVVLLHYGESLVYGEVDHYDAGDDDLKNVFSSNPFAVSVAPFPSNSGLKVPTVSSNVKGYEFDNFNQENMDSSLLVKENTQTGTLSTIKRFNFRSHPSSLLAKVKGRGIRNVERVGDNGLVLVSADLADASGQHAFCNLLTNSQQTSRINFDLKSVCFFLDQCDIRMKDIFNSICSGSENAIGNEDSRKKTSPKAFRLHHQEYGGGIFDADLSFQAFKNKLSISSHAASVTYNKTKKDYIYLYTIYFVLLMTSLAVTVSVLLLWWLRSSPFSSLLPQGPFVMQWVQSLYYLMNFIKSKEKSVLLSKFMASYDSTFSYDDVVESVNQNLSDDSSKVGALTIEETILGYGSQGTVVFRGSLNGRPVAVKRMLAHFNSSAERYFTSM